MGLFHVNVTTKKVFLTLFYSQLGDFGDISKRQSPEAQGDKSTLFLGPVLWCWEIFVKAACPGHCVPLELPEPRAVIDHRAVTIKGSLAFQSLWFPVL